MYDRIAVAQSQGLAAGPHGTTPPRFPVFSKPIVNLKGMGVGTRILCGYLQCADLLFNPVLRALPRLMRVRPSTPQAAQWRETTLHYALEQSGHFGCSPFRTSSSKCDSHFMQTYS